MTTSVSIPFIAGQWSLPPRPGPAIRRARVSIPFIAGQWSLPPHAGGAARRGGARLNPLHCGAVVASMAQGLGLLEPLSS